MWIILYGNAIIACDGESMWSSALLPSLRVAVCGVCVCLLLFGMIRVPR